MQWNEYSYHLEGINFINVCTDRAKLFQRQVNKIL